MWAAGANRSNGRRKPRMSTWAPTFPEDGNLEVEYEVDTSRVGQNWRVVLKHNGRVFFRGTRATRAPSGSFEVRRVVNNARGRDKVRAHARNLRSGQTCGGRASF